ncbi:CAP domain-containing protein [Yinghuangia soli]|uniref:CAP domain-containing protein n=1 Tax=Yinghuangia soli TaxID=2908204 RepID=A0AA41PU47_9ACTN|nr:CAP domain-containing protein [Yinghuangia soli]MCF2525910.1 CAP domain-containing protein [Yinghuangia soli]
MSTTLAPGANRPLPDGALTLRVPGPFDLSLLVTGDDGRVSGDADFVFFNQTTAPGVRLERDSASVNPGSLRRGATRVTLVVSPADPSARLGSLPTPALTVTDRAGAVLARFTPHPVTHETVLLLAELYARNGTWKIRALGQGYADGLAGIARDFGVDVIDEPAPAPARVPARTPAPPSAPTPARAPAPNRHVAPPSAPAPHIPQPAGPHLTPDGNNPFAPRPAQSPSTPPRPQAPPPMPAMPSTPELDHLRTQVIALTNAERARHGMGALAYEPRLTQAAQVHSDDMAARDYFDHTGLDGRQPADRVTASGYVYSRCAENIAAGQPTPAEVVTGWMNSPGHRANILTPELTQIGIGIAYGGSYRIYWTQVFGTPR